MIKQHWLKAVEEVLYKKPELNVMPFQDEVKSLLKEVKNSQ
jgi:hypothetical protein